jgi:hypothetical protein
VKGRILDSWAQKSPEPWSHSYMGPEIYNNDALSFSNSPPQTIDSIWNCFSLEC